MVCGNMLGLYVIDGVKYVTRCDKCGLEYSFIKKEFFQIGDRVKLLKKTESCYKDVYYYAGKIGTVVEKLNTFQINGMWVMPYIKVKFDDVDYDRHQINTGEIGENVFEISITRCDNVEVKENGNSKL
jgi:hypothetical protein